MHLRIFRTKFDSEQLLLEPFFDLMCIFGSDESLSESSFLFLYIVRVLQETEDEYYEMLQKISTHLVEHCLFTYFRDERATGSS